MSPRISSTTSQQQTRAQWNRPAAHRLHAARVTHVAPLNVHCCLLSIVGDDDNGQLFTEREYEEYKHTVADARLNHRLYCSWRNTALALDCRQIGPASQCFCTHRYRQHATDNWETKDVHCKVAGCECRLYSYLPIRGSQEAKCHCKHAHDQHNPRTKRCRHSTLAAQKAVTNGSEASNELVPASASTPSSSTASQRRGVSTRATGATKRPIHSNTTLVPRPTRSARPIPSPSSSSAGGGCQCDFFRNSNSCSCGSPWSQHVTAFESREEREAQGRPVDRYGGTLYQAMGGVTGFTSLVDGADKLSLEEEKRIQRAPLTTGTDGRVRHAQPQLGSGDDSGWGQSAVVSLAAGDERKQRDLRRGKVTEGDEMALYEHKYRKSMSVRSRTGLRPLTPQRIETDSTRLGSGTPRRSSFNTSMKPEPVACPTSVSSSSSSSCSTTAASSARRSLSSRSSAAASPHDSASSSAASSPRRSSATPRKPAVPVQPGRRASGRAPAVEM